MGHPTVEEIEKILLTLGEWSCIVGISPYSPEELFSVSYERDDTSLESVDELCIIRIQQGASTERYDSISMTSDYFTQNTTLKKSKHFNSIMSYERTDRSLVEFLKFSISIEKRLLSSFRELFSYCTFS
jgi:hypothetical protein